MFQMLSSLLGGSGLFLLGMLLLTDGVKSFAGSSLGRALLRFTGTPAKACFSGMLATLLVQSSSATTVTVIGFVSAGLLTFPQALGVVFGASLGTTGTGWLVAFLGLKINLGAHALLMVFAGAGMRLFGRGRWRPAGMALAGFGLIFTGVDALQHGMAGLAEDVSLAALPPGGIGGHAAAVAVGLVLTLVMQSSSAAVAATMAALQAGTVNLEQASGIAIGAAIGTTVTAALAATGAGTPAKRTALAFVVFNLCTGIIALAALPLFLRAAPLVLPRLGLDSGPEALAVFHTTFIALGVVVFLPFVRPFANLIERLLPESGPALTRHLDVLLLQTPSVAIEASGKALREASIETFRLIGLELRGTAAVDEVEENAARLSVAVRDIEEFVAAIPSTNGGRPLASQLHVIDHLVRLQSRILPADAIRRVLGTELLREAVALTETLLDEAAAGLNGSAPEAWVDSIKTHSTALATLRKAGRIRVLDESGSTMNPEDILERLDAMRWLDRVGYHAWRICHHFATPDTNVRSPRDQECHPDD